MTLVDETTVRGNRQDNHPTRIGSPMPMARPDPTVWPADSDERPAGPFDAAELAAYNADGCAVVQELLSPAEVRSYLTELARLASDERTVVEKHSRQIRSIFGGLMVMPGSHRTFVPCAGTTSEDHCQESLREQEIGESDRTAPAGGHGIVEPCAAARPRPAFVASRDWTPVGR